MIAVLAMISAAARADSRLIEGEAVILPSLWEATVAVGEPASAEFTVVWTTGASVKLGAPELRNTLGDAFHDATIDPDAPRALDDGLPHVGPDTDVAVTIAVDTSTPGRYAAEMALPFVDGLDCGVVVEMRIHVLDPAADPDDLDGDGVTAAGGDCDDAYAWASPGAPELCDDADNDCDGERDEGACEGRVVACPEEPGRTCSTVPGWSAAWAPLLALLARRRRR